MHSDHELAESCHALLFTCEYFGLYAFKHKVGIDGCICLFF